MAICKYILALLADKLERAVHDYTKDVSVVVIDSESLKDSPSVVDQAASHNVPSSERLQRTECT